MRFGDFNNTPRSLSFYFTMSVIEQMKARREYLISNGWYEKAETMKLLIADYALRNRDSCAVTQTKKDEQ